MGHPEIENGARRERYTSDEMWATRLWFLTAPNFRISDYPRVGFGRGRAAHSSTLVMNEAKQSHW